jgi:hypothetical protein
MKRRTESKAVDSVFGSGGRSEGSGRGGSGGMYGGLGVVLATEGKTGREFDTDDKRGRITPTSERKQ